MPRRTPYLRKLDFESLHYSCRVCSNHVRYFNKREQQGGNWIPRPGSSSPALRPPASCPPLPRPTYTPTAILPVFRFPRSVYHLHLYRDNGDPVTVSTRVPRAAGDLQPSDRNGNSYSFEILFTRRRTSPGSKRRTVSFPAASPLRPPARVSADD